MDLNAFYRSMCSTEDMPCVTVSIKDFTAKGPAAFAAWCRQNKIKGVIAIHAYHAASLFFDTSDADRLQSTCPYAIILGGTGKCF